METAVFKKQLVHFDQEAYQEAVKLSRQKLRLLADCVQWVSNHISDLNIEMFVTDGMLEHFLDRLKDDQTELKKLGIKDPTKMCDLLSIDLNTLVQLEDKFNKCEGRIRFSKGKAMENVDEEIYKVYTVDDADNNRLRHAKKIIKVLNDAIKDNVSINTNHIGNATGGLVHWWPYGERGFRYNWQAFRR